MRAGWAIFIFCLAQACGSQEKGSPSPLAESARIPVEAPAAIRFAERDAAAPTPIPAARAAEILSQVRRLLAGSPGALAAAVRALPPEPPHGIVLSLSRPAAAAVLSGAVGASWEEALGMAVASLNAGAAMEGRLRIDLLADLGPSESALGLRLAPGLEGLYFEAEGELLPPDLILARDLVDAKGRLDPSRLQGLAGRRAVGELEVRGARFISWMEGSEGEPVPLLRGNLRFPEVSPESLLAAAVAGGEYLLRHRRADGSFEYRYDPIRDRYLGGENLLRQAGTCHALLELHGATGEERFRAAASQGLRALLRHARPPRPEDREASFETIVSPGEQAKLGGAALVLLALVDLEQSGGDSYRSRALSLARFLLFQQGSDGRFASKYFYRDDGKPFESLYYPGEAVLALSRLYRLTLDPIWLQAARRGATWLIEVRDADKADRELPHDHWLLMGLRELDELSGEPLFRRHAERLAAAILAARRVQGEPEDWVGTFYDPPRSTPSATRAEGLVAAAHLARRAGLDETPYMEALLAISSFQLRCQLRAENTHYLPRPDRANGGLRRSLSDFEVRIDYVQHTISALLGTRELLLTAKNR